MLLSVVVVVPTCFPIKTSELATLSVETVPTIGSVSPVGATPATALPKPIVVFQAMGLDSKVNIVRITSTVGMG